MISKTDAENLSKKNKPLSLSWFAFNLFISIQHTVSVSSFVKMFTWEDYSVWYVVKSWHLSSPCSLESSTEEGHDGSLECAVHVQLSSECSEAWKHNKASRRWLLCMHTQAPLKVKTSGKLNRGTQECRKRAGTLDGSPERPWWACERSMNMSCC